MVIKMKINDLTHKIINFEKRNVMDDFNRNLIILVVFKWDFDHFTGFCEETQKVAFVSHRNQ